MRKTRQLERRFGLLCAATLVTILPLPSVIIQAGDTPAMVSYGEGIVQTPKYRTWNGLDWARELSANFVGGTIYWSVLRGHPSKAEAILAVLDATGHLNVQVWDGDSWGTVLELTTAIGSTNSMYRGFDLAYEQSSGDAIIVYQNNANDPLYRIWNGASWSAPATLDLPTSNIPVWIALRSNPSSDEMVMMAIDLGDSVCAAVWGGNSWGNTITLEDDATTHDREHIAIGYECTSGRAMVIWGESGFNTPQYRFWNGTSWGAEGSVPTIGGNPTWIRLASDPSGNTIAMAASDWGADLNVNIWNGSSWGIDLEYDTKMEGTVSRSFDVVFEQSGDQAVVAWGHTNQQTLSYATWNVGSGWSLGQVGPDLGGDIELVQLVADPDSDELMLGTITDDRDLQLTLWTGSAWGTPDEADTSTSEQRYEPYMISYRPGAVTWTWIYPASGSIGGIVSSPVIRGGRVYVGSDDGYLYCLSASSGSLIWTYAAGDRIRSSPAAAYESGKWVLYFGCDTGYAYAVEDMGSSPQLKWSIPLQTPLSSSPALWQDTLLFIGSADSLQCRSTDDGTRNWAQHLGGLVYSSPAVYWDDVWIGSNSDYLYKFSIDGTPLGSYLVCGNIVVPVWMAYWDGRVAVGSYASATPGSDAMYLILNNLSLESEFFDGGNLARTYTSCFSLNDTTVYFGNDNDHLYCIDISTAPPTLLYKYDTGDDIQSSPLCWNDVVYFGSNNNCFYALDDATRKPKPDWPFITNDDIISSPAIDISANVVVVGSLDGHVYAFNLE